jgi:hypothetical protein
MGGEGGRQSAYPTHTHTYTHIHITYTYRHGYMNIRYTYRHSKKYKNCTYRRTRNDTSMISGARHIHTHMYIYSTYQHNIRRANWRPQPAIDDMTPPPPRSNKPVTKPFICSPSCPASHPPQPPRKVCAGVTGVWGGIGGRRRTRVW